MRRISVLLPFLLAVLIAPACSSTPAICGALEQGQDPLAAARTAYGDAHGDKPTAVRMLRQGVNEVRGSCPSHEGAARTMDQLAGIVARGR